MNQPWDIWNVLKPVYHRLGDPRRPPHPDDLHRVTWKRVGTAMDMDDAKQLVCRPVLERINPPVRGR